MEVIFFLCRKKKSTMKKTIFVIALAAVLSMLPIKSYGQFGSKDALSLEAGIYSHKKAGSKVLGRQAQEVLNMALMDKVKTSSGEYKDIHNALDKYYQAFNLVQLSLDALASGVQIYTDVEAIAEDLVKLITLLNDFKSYCEDHGINIKECIGVYTSFDEYGDVIVNDCKKVYSTAVGYAQSIITKSATTQQLLTGITSISDDIHIARKDIDRLYRSLYYTIMLRRGYWNPGWGHFIVHPTSKYTSDALERWHTAMSKNLSKVKRNK